MRVLRWLFLLINVGFCLLADGQAKLSFTIDSFPTQIVYGDTTQRTRIVYIHNRGNLAFNDVVTLEYTVNDTLFSGSNITSTGLYLNTPTISIAPGDSSPQQLIINSDFHAYHILGPSGVVIWPISNSAYAYDYSFYKVKVRLVAAIDPVTEKRIQVFINQQQLFVKTDEQNLLKRVRIFGVDGKLIVDVDLTSSSVIPLGPIAAGCYLVEVVLNDDSRKVFKLVNLGGH